MSCTREITLIFLARLFFEEKKSSYCHDPGVVVGVVKNFNLDHNFFIIQATSMKLHTLVHHHKGYNLTKGHNSMRLFDKIMPLYGLGK